SQYVGGFEPHPKPERQNPSCRGASDEIEIVGEFAQILVLELLLPPRKHRGRERAFDAAAIERKNAKRRIAERLPAHQRQSAELLDYAIDEHVDVLLLGEFAVVRFREAILQIVQGFEICLEIAGRRATQSREQETG